MNNLLSSDLKLVGIITLFRHGARTPLQFIDTKEVPSPVWCPEKHLLEISESKILHKATYQPGIAFNKLLPGGAPKGSLTEAGQKQIIQLGQTYRQRYMNELNFIPEEYDPNFIYVRSTGVHRNLLSARCFMAGLYSTDHFHKINAPVEINIELPEKEVFYPNKMAFPHMVRVAENGYQCAAQLPEVIELKKKLKKCLNLKTLKDSLNHSSKTDDLPVYMVRDDFISRLVHNFSIPFGFMDLLTECNSLASKELLYEILGCENEWIENMPCAVGPAFNTILDNIRHIIHQISSPRVYLYATHDSLLLPLLVSLGLTNPTWPPYGADLHFEIYTKTNHVEIDCQKEYFIRIVYLDNELPMHNLLATHPFKSIQLSNNHDDHQGKTSTSHSHHLPWIVFESFINSYLLQK